VGYATTRAVAEEFGSTAAVLSGEGCLGGALLIRCLTGGGMSLGNPGCAALLSVFIARWYGGGRGGMLGAGGCGDDADRRHPVWLRYILLASLAVASHIAIDEYVLAPEAHRGGSRNGAAEAAAGTSASRDAASVRRLRLYR